MARQNIRTILLHATCLRRTNRKRKFIGWRKGFSRYNGPHEHHTFRRNDFSSYYCGHDICRSIQELGTVANISSPGPKTRLGLNQQFRGFYSAVGASPRQMADLEERVWSAVGSNVKDPETELHLHKLGWLHRRLAVSREFVDDVSGTGNRSSIKYSIQIILQLPTLLHPTLELLKSMVRKEAKREIDRWVSDNDLLVVDSSGSQCKIEVEIKSIAKQPIPWTVQSGQQSQDDVKSRLGPGLANVSHFLAVYSCKGGVGKSTVAVNLAYELARLGGRVGLLDADIYGPSLPLMIDPDDDTVRKSSLGASMVRPIEYKGVKLLSLGYVSSNSGIPGSGKSDHAAILRGPMAGRVTTQLLKGTEWGDLDVLILDLPPGTGDVQLTVCQEISLSFAVGVTTPSKLAIADARKGISMFNAMGIETVAMVENMSFFQCNDGSKHYPFGRGFTGDVSTMNKSLGSNVLSPQNICQLPISGTANEANDKGTPICVSRPKEAKQELEAFEKLAEIVSRELFQLPYREPSSEGIVLIQDEHFDISTIHLSDDGGSLLIRFFSENGALQKRVPPENLHCRDPMSGEIIDGASTTRKVDDNNKSVIVTRHESKSNSSKILPERIEEKGRVGFEVVWSDGSKYIYRRSVIALAAGGAKVES